MLLSNNLLIFGFGPQVRYELRRKNVIYHNLYTLFNIAFMTILIFCCSHLMALVYIVLILFITFGVPLLFIYVYSFKNDVRGPWDLPKVRDYSHLD
jgi:hypothetical protein